jgi:hypothetical protein
MALAPEGPERERVPRAKETAEQFATQLAPTASPETLTLALLVLKALAKAGSTTVCRPNDPTAGRVVTVVFHTVGHSKMKGALSKTVGAGRGYCAMRTEPALPPAKLSFSVTGASADHGDVVGNMATP